MADCLYYLLRELFARPIDVTSIQLQIEYPPPGTQPRVFQFSTSWLSTANSEVATVSVIFSPFILNADELEAQFWGVAFKLFHEYASHAYAHRLGNHPSLSPTSAEALVAIGSQDDYDIYFEGWMLYVEWLVFERWLPAFMPDPRARNLTRQAAHRAVISTLSPAYVGPHVRVGAQNRAPEIGWHLAATFFEAVASALEVGFQSEQHVSVFVRMSAEIAAAHWLDFNHSAFVDVIQQQRWSAAALETAIHAALDSDKERIDPREVAQYLS